MILAIGVEFDEGGARGNRFRGEGAAIRLNGFTVRAVSVEMAARGCRLAIFSTIISIDNDRQRCGRRLLTLRERISQ
jgi:hypothetical protein